MKLWSCASGWRNGNSAVALHYWSERSCCGQLPFLLSAELLGLPHTWKAKFLEATKFKIILELRNSPLLVSICSFLPCNLQGGETPVVFFTWYPWAMKPRSRWSLLAQMILTGMSAWTKGWWVFHWHGREEMDQIHQWNQLKKNRNSNKQTNVARKLKGNERKAWCMSWHKHKKFNDRTEKWFFSGMDFWDLLGWASIPKRRVQLTQKLKQSWHKALKKLPRVFPPRCDRTGEEQTKPEARGGSWGTAPELMPERSWQHSTPREGHTVKWEFSCPTCLSCKTTAALESCKHLIISRSGIFRVPSANSISFNCAGIGTMLPFCRAHGRAA